MIHFIGAIACATLLWSWKGKTIRKIYSRADTRIIVRDALANAGLTQRQKEAIYLVFYKRMTQEDAANILNVSQQAVGKFIRLALVKLRKYLEEIGIDGCKICV